VVPIEEAERFALRHERQAMGWSSDQEFSVRLYRVINCLNAVRMGNSGQQQAGSEHDQLVLKARDGYQQVQTVEYHRHLTECAIKWDWRIIDREIRSMQYSDFERVYDNLQKRVAYATKKKGSLRTRTELEQFVELMRKVREAA
jgi:hypothetical protein